MAFQIFGTQHLGGDMPPDTFVPWDHPEHPAFTYTERNTANG